MIGHLLEWAPRWALHQFEPLTSSWHGQNCSLQYSYLLLQMLLNYLGYVGLLQDERVPEQQHPIKIWKHIITCHTWKMKISKYRYPDNSNGLKDDSYLWTTNWSLETMYMNLRRNLMEAFISWEYVREKHYENVAFLNTFSLLIGKSHHYFCSYFHTWLLIFFYKIRNKKRIVLTNEQHRGFQRYHRYI